MEDAGEDVKSIICNIQTLLLSYGRHGRLENK